MKGIENIEIAWSGDSDHSRMIASELDALISTFKSGTVRAETGSIGHGPNSVVSVEKRTRGSWAIRLREHMTTIQSVGDQPMIRIDMDQIHDTCGSGGDEKTRIESAFRHVQLARALLRSENRHEADHNELKLRDLATTVGQTALIDFGPAREAHVLLSAAGFFETSHLGSITLIGAPEGARNPRIAQPLLDHIRETIPQSVTVAVESEAIALIGPLQASVLVKNDPMTLIRSAAASSLRSDWLQ